MSEKKQNSVKKTMVGKEVNHFDLVETFGDDQNTQTGNIEILDNLIKSFETYKGHGNIHIHFHNAPCTVNHIYPDIETSDEDDLLGFLIKIVPLMVKDSSITAADFLAAVLKELPLMVKDSSITQMELFAVMVVVRETLRANSN